MTQARIFEANYTVEAAGAPFLLAEPFDTRHQVYLGVECAGGTVEGTVPNQFGGQRALLVKPAGEAPVRLTYRFADAPGTPPAWLPAPMPTAWLKPSDALAAEIRAVVTATDPAAILRQVIDHTAAHFDYGHPDSYLGTDHAAMPALACDVTLGSCVDIHSYAIAALAVFGIPATYLSGIYCEGEARDENPQDCLPGHCWMESYAEGRTQDWDIAHVLKFGLARPVAPVLNPHPGRRVALQAGRGHVFTVEGREIAVDRIHKPVFASGDVVGSLAAFTTRFRTLAPVLAEAV